MTRTVRASIAAAFGYLQFALAMGSGFFIVPFTIHRLGTARYGLWLASGELLAYAAMADLGVSGTLPWLIAEAEGRGDRDEMRRLVVHGTIAAVAIAITYIAIVLGLWNFVPSLLRLSEADRAAISGPLAALACVTAATLPWRSLAAVLAGLQDVKYLGTMSSISWALDLVLTMVLLARGYGLWALAAAVVVPSVLGTCANVARVRQIAPDLLREWPRPRWQGVVRLFRESIGGWFGQLGWRFTSASDGIIVAALGSSAAVATLACTSKLAAMLTQMSWVPGDSSLVALASLHGERKPERLRAAVIALCRVYVALAACGACVILAANPMFVTRWVGANVYGGLRLNALVAGAILAMTAGHMFAVVTSVLGARMHVGVATAICGGIQITLAYALGRALGLDGVVTASIVTQCCILVPSVIVPFARLSGVSAGDLARRVVLPLALRIGPVAAAAWAIGYAVEIAPLWIVMMTAACVGSAALLATRRIYLDYPPALALADSLMAKVLPAPIRARLLPRNAAAEPLS